MPAAANATPAAARRCQTAMSAAAACRRDVVVATTQRYTTSANRVAPVQQYAITTMRWKMVARDSSIGGKRRAQMVRGV